MPRLTVVGVQFAPLVPCSNVYFGCGSKIDNPGHRHRDPNIDGELVVRIDDFLGIPMRVRVPFRRGPSVDHPVYKVPVWGWDGNDISPTLNPSFLLDHNGIRVHFFYKNGRVEMLSDSNVELAE